MRTFVLLTVAAATLITGGVSAAASPSAHASAASSTSAAGALPHTRQVVVRPVHANGTPVAGYTVTRESIDGFSCDEGPSPVAVDPGIRFCGFSATYTVACWKSAHHTVLCLRNPLTRALVRIRYTGAFAPVAAPAHPSPQALVLRGRGYCTIRDGGAWGSVPGHPHWFGTYSCLHSAIYGTGPDGIDRSVDPWLVHTVTGYTGAPGSIHDRRVAVAYYAGTAA